MYNVLRIEGDPASWILENAQIQAVAQELAGSSGPVTLQVVAPLQGRLVLSAKSAGSGPWRDSRSATMPAKLIPV